MRWLGDRLDGIPEAERPFNRPLPLAAMPLYPSNPDDSFDIVGCKGQCLTAKDYHKRGIGGAVTQNGS